MKIKSFPYDIFNGATASCLRHHLKANKSYRKITKLWERAEIYVPQSDAWFMFYIRSIYFPHFLSFSLYVHALPFMYSLFSMKFDFCHHRGKLFLCLLLDVNVVILLILNHSMVISMMLCSMLSSSISRKNVQYKLNLKKTILFLKTFWY